MKSSMPHTCVKQHSFDLTPDMVKPNKANRGFSVSCPTCNAPAPITYEKAADMFGTTRDKLKDIMRIRRETGIPHDTPVDITMLDKSLDEVLDLDVDPLEDDNILAVQSTPRESKSDKSKSLVNLVNDFNDETPEQFDVDKDAGAGVLVDDDMIDEALKHPKLQESEAIPSDKPKPQPREIPSERRVFRPKRAEPQDDVGGYDEPPARPRPKFERDQERYEQPQREQRRPTRVHKPELPTDFGSFDDDEPKTKFQMLQEIVKSQELPRDDENQILQYLYLKQDGWTPSTLKAFLIDYGISEPRATQMSKRFSFMLDIEDLKKKRQQKLMGYVEEPFDRTGLGEESPNPANDFMKMMQAQLMGGNSSDPSAMMQQMLMRQMQQNQSQMSPLEQMQMFTLMQQMQQQPKAQQQQSTSPEEQLSASKVAQMIQSAVSQNQSQILSSVKSILEEKEEREKESKLERELESLRRELTSKPSSDNESKMMDKMFEMMNKMTEKPPAQPQPPAPQDPIESNPILRKIVDSYFNSTSTQQSEVVNAINAMNQKIEEVSRSGDQSFLGGKFRSPEEIQAYVKLREVLGKLDLQEEEFSQQREKREFLKSISGDVIRQAGEIIEKAMSGNMIPEGAPEGTKPTPVREVVKPDDGTITMECPTPNCGATLLVPADAARVMCPECETIFEREVRDEHRDIAESANQKYREEAEARERMEVTSEQITEVTPSQPPVEIPELPTVPTPPAETSNGVENPFAIPSIENIGTNASYGHLKLQDPPKNTYVSDSSGLASVPATDGDVDGGSDGDNVYLEETTHIGDDEITPTDDGEPDEKGEE